MADNKEIQINSYQLPVLNKELLVNTFNPNFDLATMFEDTKIQLIEKIKAILL